jgi:aminopeptidase N
MTLPFGVRRSSFVGLGAAAIAACLACSSAPDPGPRAETAEVQQGAVDVHSFARPAEARVTHVALDLRADMQAHELRGTATLTVGRRAGATELVLDTRDLEIEKVTDGGSAVLERGLGDADPIKGQPLTVKLGDRDGPVVITYKTRPTAAALQWLAPEQTAGKRQPYLFSQGQAILTRTWIPTQDSPGIRQTYSAKITVPAPLRAVMSAEHVSEPAAGSSGERTFEFRMTNPVPPYLIALAIGDIADKAIGPRTAVYTEPSGLDRAASEFVDLERMVEAAERLAGPYRWGRYDLLVLPPSFPFGGMENPRLTFATPTVIAGDRSLVSLVAHELAHSWSGNLVTNATWSDFWLNEGITTYLEARIMEEVYGKERADMLRVLGRRDLDAEVARLSGPSAHDTILHIDLAGRDPDEGSTDIPYEKGSLFLQTIEAAVGRERFDTFLRSYFDRHAFQSITSAVFLDDRAQDPGGGRRRARTAPPARRVGLQARRAVQRRGRHLTCAGSRRGPGQGFRQRRDREVDGRRQLEHPGVAALPRQSASEADACAAAGSRSRLSPD